MGQDLRDFINDLEERNELARVRAEVDWNEELGAITREISSQYGPALLFENIKGHQEHFVPAAVYQRHRHQEAAVLDPRRCRNTHDRDIVRVFKERFAKPVKPVT